jgi:hypothetical protein
VHITEATDGVAHQPGTDADDDSVEVEGLSGDQPERGCQEGFAVRACRFTDR